MIPFIEIGAVCAAAVNLLSPSAIRPALCWEHETRGSPRDPAVRPRPQRPVRGLGARPARPGYGFLFAAAGGPNHDGKIVVVRFHSDLTAPVRSIAEVPGRADITFNTQRAGVPRQIPGATFLTQGSAQPWILADPARPGHIYVVSAPSPPHGAQQPPLTSVVAVEESLVQALLDAARERRSTVPDLLHP